MSEALPSRVDALRLAGRDALIKNVTPFAAMTRLAGLLTDTEGVVESELRFTRDAQGRSTVNGHAAARLRLTCQRCLEPLESAVSVHIAAAVVGDEASEASLPEGIEAVWSEGGEVSPLAVVEDELILALPVVAMHEECSAPVEATPAATGPSNPFAALKVLKDRQR